MTAEELLQEAAGYEEKLITTRRFLHMHPGTGFDIEDTVAYAHIITSLQELHARELALTDEAVLTIGSIHGGAAANVIPDTVELGGTIRTYDEEIRSFMKTRMTDTVIHSIIQRLNLTSQL